MEAVHPGGWPASRDSIRDRGGSEGAFPGAEVISRPVRVRVRRREVAHLFLETESSQKKLGEREGPRTAADLGSQG